MKQGVHSQRPSGIWRTPAFGRTQGERMLFSLLVNPLTGKDLDWADPSKHPSVPALGRAVINKCFTEVCTPVRVITRRALM
jgi:hypothetical protein